MARKNPQAAQDIDSLLGELDAMAAPASAPGGDDLDNLLDDLGALDAPADELEPDDAGFAPTHNTAPTALPVPTGAGRARRRLAALAALALASHGALFALGFWLGGAAGGHHAVPAPVPAAPRLEGVMRYVGQQSDARVDGQVIFTDPEIRRAVLELAGGQALADAMTRFARNLRALGPITRHGDLIEARACNPAACASEAYSLRYDSHSHQIQLCQTAPFASGASLSYLYDAEGMREVAGCVGANAGQPVVAAPARAAAAEPDPAETGAAPAASAHAAVD